MYIHQLKDWPNFHWNNQALETALADVRHCQGRLIGRMEGLGFDLKREASFQSLTQEVLKTSEIEGEILDSGQVRSSLAKRLGLKLVEFKPASREVDGVVEMMLDATQNFNKPLTAKRLFGWHTALFPTGLSGVSKITVGTWRNANSDPLQVVSGPIGRERVHYEAPEGSQIRRQMSKFLQWFEKGPDMDLVLKSGVAHLWFVTIHPFDDGNGRIARAIADMALARSEQIPQRFYSMSAQILRERSKYYEVLERTQKGTMDITAWLSWFLGCLARSIDRSEFTLADVLRKSRFWQTVATAPILLNDRQRIVLNRALNGLNGKLTSSRWAKLAKCSQDTALRDITDLLERGVLIREPNGGGRSTSYAIADAMFAAAPKFGKT
jgi:Fic family protein